MNQVDDLYGTTVSAVIPTLNEAKNLPLIIPYLPMNYIHEVILVDGHSKDGTIEIANSLLPSIRVVTEHKRGSGTTDMPCLRKLGNRFFVILVNLLFGCNFTDLAYGYHGFWRYCLNAIDLAGIDGFEIDTVLYLRAVKEKLRIVEIPSFEGERFYGEGKLKTFPDGWRVLKTILREWDENRRFPGRTGYPGFRGYTPNQKRDSAITRDRPSYPEEMKVKIFENVYESQDR